MNPLPKNSKSKVSVIIPIYNIELYVRECVESVLAQSYRELEIILVDDGSTDSCPQLCDAFLTRDDRIRVIHRQNGGLSAARNSGIKAATGEYLVFLDGDDYLSPIAIEQLLTVILKENTAIGVTSFSIDPQTLSDSVSEETFSLSASDAIKEIFSERRFFTSAWGKIYKRELFTEIHFPEGLIYEDFAVMYRLFDLAKKVAFCDAKIYFYRYTTTSITHSAFRKKRMDYFTVTDEVTEFIEKNYPEVRKTHNERTVHNAISFYQSMSICGYDDADDIKRVRSYVKKYYKGYIFSRYPFLSKMYGLAIVLAPKIALKMFHR